jgi:predicted GNAT family acetyltransferase
MTLENIPVHLNTTEHRFEMIVDGEPAIINYKKAGNTVYLIHTEVAESLEGHGVAGALVKKTLQYLEEHHFKMVPYCSYVQQYLQKHPEWNRIVIEE